MFTIILYLQEIKNIQLEESSNEKDDDEMDVSDDDEPSKKKHRTDTGIEEKNNLKDENDSLRCQMEAYKNEVNKFMQLSILFLTNFSKPNFA